MLWKGPVGKAIAKLQACKTPGGRQGCSEGKLLSMAAGYLEANGRPLKGAGRNRDRLVLVDPEPGHNQKNTDETKNWSNGGHRVFKKGQIVGTGIRKKSLHTGELKKKGVVGDNEEEGSKGTPLLNPP